MTTAKTEPDSLIRAVTTLIDVLDHESTALTASDFSVSGALAATKRDAIERLETTLAGTSAPANRPSSRLTSLQHRLDAAIAKNRALLQCSIDTQQRVIATLVHALEPVERDRNYPTTEHGHRVSHPVALVLHA